MQEIISSIIGTVFTQSKNQLLGRFLEKWYT